MKELPVEIRVSDLPEEQRQKALWDALDILLRAAKKRRTATKRSPQGADRQAPRKPP